MVETIETFFAGSFECDKVEDGKINDKKCKKYTGCEVDGNDLTLFIKDGRIIGSEIDNSLIQARSVISYKFSASESKFVIDSMYEGCDESAYSPPKQGLCPTTDSSSLVTKSFMVMFMSLLIATLF